MDDHFSYRMNSERDRLPPMKARWFTGGGEEVLEGEVGWREKGWGRRGGSQQL